MTEQELQELRSQKWRTNGQPIRTLEDAREFIESVGFCLVLPLRPAVLVPTFIGAFSGDTNNLPTWQHAYADPRTKEANELMVRLLRGKHAYEANLFGETPFLVAASVFPYFYGLVGDRNPRQVPKTGSRSEYSTLAAHMFQAIQKDGPISKPRLKDILGGEPSAPALDRSLNELWSKLRITRVDYNPEEGASWDVLFRWSPDLVREGMNLSMAEALTALVSKYLDCVIAAEQTEVEEFFGHFVSKSRVRDAINALLSARELQLTHSAGRTLLQITQEREPILPRTGVRPPRPEPRPARPSMSDKKPRSASRQSRSDRPGGDRPRSDRQRSDRQRSDRPGSGRPRSDKPRGDRPGGGSSRPRTDRPRTDRPRTDRPPRTGTPRPANPRTDVPPTEKPGNDSTE